MSADQPAPPEPPPTRRDFLKAAGGLGLAGGLSLGAWGALEWAVPRGTAATWHKSVCRYCGNGCGVRVGMTGGRITDVRGDEEAHNKGIICVKGATLYELPYVGGRLLRPMVRKGDKKDGAPLVETTWEEALALVARTFKEALAKPDGKKRVAFYGSGQLYSEESYTANKLFKAGIGTNNVDGNPRLCMASAAAGYTSVFGKDEPCGTFEDLDHADCFFIFGANPAECHPPTFERIRLRKENHPGTQVIVVDPRRTRTAELADLHLPVVPGTDLLLLNAMAQVMCADGLIDRDFIRDHVVLKRTPKHTGDPGLEALRPLRAFLDKSYTPEQVAERLGASATAIRDAAYRFAKAKATMSLWTMGVNQRTQGTALNQMLMALHLLTGHICRPGATPLSLTGQANACGGVRDTGSLAHALPNGRLVASDADRAEMEKLWGVPAGTIAPQPGYHAVRLFREMAKGNVDAVLILCTNPAQSLPNARKYREAMRNTFVVVGEAFGDSETAKLADVLLPAALWVEKEGVFGQTDRHYQLIEKLLDPPGEARSDLAILTDLADRLGHGGLIKARTPAEVWDEYRALSAHSKYNFAGMTRERLRKEHGIQWPCPTEDHPGTKRRYLVGDDPFAKERPGVQARKDVDFYGRPDGRAVVYLRDYEPVPEKADLRDTLYLTTGRVLEQWHTGTMTGRIEELARAAGPGHFEMNEEDAQRRGIRDGDRVEVASEYGKLAGMVKVSRGPRQGVVFASFYDAKFLINNVVADHLDPTSFEPEFKVTAVRVRRLEG
jgi:nitrate reductase NapA